MLPFVQFKKREKHPWKNVTFGKVALLKATLFYGCFSRFSNCANGTKSRKASHVQNIDGARLVFLYFW